MYTHCLSPVPVHCYMYSNLHNMFSVDSVLSELAAARGWQVAGETVHIRKQEELIKPKKILAKIDMESEWQELEEGRQLLPSDHPVVYIAMNYNIVNPFHVWEDSLYCLCGQNSQYLKILSPTAGVSGILAAAVK